MNITASASAKTILFGEHAVVYGEPAIAIPLSNLRTIAELYPNHREFRIISEKICLNKTYKELIPESGLQRLLDLLMQTFSFKVLPPDTLVIRSDIPVASGLGSGAALSVAVIRAFSLYYRKIITDEQVNDIAFEIEKIYHGTPSGIDNTVIAFEQPIIFSKKQGFKSLSADISRFPLLVIDSGIRSRTIDVVSDVKANYEQNQSYIREIGSLIPAAETALKSANIKETGYLMNKNQELLQRINVSCPELDEMIGFGLKNGAIGGKLTGAGRGGNILILAENAEQAAVLKNLYEEKGLRVFL